MAKVSVEVAHNVVNIIIIIIIIIIVVVVVVIKGSQTVGKFLFARHGETKNEGLFTE